MPVVSRGARFTVVAHLLRRGVAVRSLLTEVGLVITDELGRNINHGFDIEAPPVPLQIQASATTQDLVFRLRVLDTFPAGSFLLALTATPVVKFEVDNAPPTLTAGVVPSAANSAALRFTVVDSDRDKILRVVSMERIPRGVTGGEDLRAIKMARIPGGSEFLPVGAEFTVQTTLKNTTGRALTLTSITVAIRFRGASVDPVPPTTALLGAYFLFHDEGSDALTDVVLDPGDSDTYVLEFHFRILETFPGNYLNHPIVILPTIRYRLQAEDPPHDLEGPELEATLDGDVLSNESVVFSVRGPADVKAVSLTRDPGGPVLRGQTFEVKVTFDNEALTGGDAPARVTAFTLALAREVTRQDATDYFDVTNPSPVTLDGGEQGHEVTYIVRVLPTFPDGLLVGDILPPTFFFQPAAEFQRNEQPPVLAASIESAVYGQGTFQVSPNGAPTGSGVRAVQIYRDKHGVEDFGPGDKMTWYVELRNYDGVDHTIPDDTYYGFSVETVDDDQDAEPVFTRDVMPTLTIPAGRVRTAVYKLTIVPGIAAEYLNRQMRFIPGIGYAGGSVSNDTQVSENTGVLFKVVP